MLPEDLKEIENDFLRLGIPVSASYDEAKAAYRDLAKILHPDRHMHDQKVAARATEQFKLLQGAWSRLQVFYDYQEAIERQRKEQEEADNRQREDEERERGEREARAQQQKERQERERQEQEQARRQKTEAEKKSQQEREAAQQQKKEQLERLASSLVRG